MIYINTGHNHPYQVNSASINALNEVGLLLSILPNTLNYELCKVLQNSGDIIYIFTEGVSESKNKSNDEFGEDKLEKLLKKSLSLNSRSLLNEIFEEVNMYPFRIAVPKWYKIKR